MHFGLQVSGDTAAMSNKQKQHHKVTECPALQFLLQLADALVLWHLPGS